MKVWLCPPGRIYSLKVSNVKLGQSQTAQQETKSSSQILVGLVELCNFYVTIQNKNDLIIEVQSNFTQKRISDSLF